MIRFSKVKMEFEKKLGRSLSNDEKSFLKYMYEKQESELMKHDEQK